MRTDASSFVVKFRAGLEDDPIAGSVSVEEIDDPKSWDKAADEGRIIHYEDKSALVVLYDHGLNIGMYDVPKVKSNFRNWVGNPDSTLEYDDGVHTIRITKDVSGRYHLTKVMNQTFSDPLGAIVNNAWGSEVTFSGNREATSKLHQYLGHYK